MAMSMLCKDSIIYSTGKRRKNCFHTFAKIRCLLFLFSLLLLLFFQGNLRRNCPLHKVYMYGYVDVVQGQYYLLNRKAEKELFPYIRENSLSFVPFFPFASGILTGKYTKNTTFAAGDTRLQKPEFQEDAWQMNLEK